MEQQIERFLASDVGYVALLGVVGLAVVVVLFAVRFLLAARVDPMQERIRRTVGAGVADLGDLDTRLESVPPQRNVGILERSMEGLAGAAKPSNEEELNALKNQLSWAGYRNERAMGYYLATKLILCVGFTGGFYLYNTSRPKPMEPAFLLTMVCMILGYYLPNMWLRNRMESRQLALNRGIPDTLDLMVTCVEAGLGLDAALNRVAEEVIISSPILGQELVQTGLEMRAGATRGEAFRRLASRTGVEDLKNLASIIVQTELFGTSIAASLRVMSDTMRVRRMNRAEESAATAGIKMTIPLVIFILPSLLLILVGSGAVRMIRALLPALGGGG